MSRMAASRKRDHSGPTLRLSWDLPWVEGGCTSTQSSAQPKKQSLKLWAQNTCISSTQTLPTFGTEATRRGGGQAGPPGALLAMSHPHTSPGCVSTERTGGVWRGRSPWWTRCQNSAFLFILSLWRLDGEPDTSYQSALSLRLSRNNFLTVRLRGKESRDRRNSGKGGDSRTQGLGSRAQMNTARGACPQQFEKRLLPAQNVPALMHRLCRSPYLK